MARHFVRVRLPGSVREYTYHLESVLPPETGAQVEILTPNGARLVTEILGVEPPDSPPPNFTTKEIFLI